MANVDNNKDGFSLFGFSIQRKKDKEPLASFVEVENTDGAIAVTAGGLQSSFVDIEGTSKNESELVTRYRSMIQQPEVQQAVDDIVNEAITIKNEQPSIECNVDNIEFGEGVKKKIRDEFKIVLKLLDFDSQGYDIFSKWYIDGRLYYHVMIDMDKPGEGIKELRNIDPRKLKRIREYDTSNNIKGAGLGFIKKVKDEYYIYSETGFGTNIATQSAFTVNSIQGLKISLDSIVNSNSGILNEKSTVILSHLHKAYRSLNQLRMMEDAVVIYRIARSPERRVFYIDTGNMPKAKAEQYLKDMMTLHKNKVIYDATTGELRDDRKFMTITDDFWLPRKEGGKGTEITTLPGGQNLGEMEDVTYFQRKLNKALNVPISRMESESVFNIGRGSEITRDEIKFAKFITRLRARFSMLFDNILEKQLVLKNIIKPDDWPLIRDSIQYDYANDNHFEELKSIDVFRERLSLLNDVTPYRGDIYSKEYIMKTVLRMSDEDIQDMQKQISKENEAAQADVQQAQQQPLDSNAEQDNINNTNMNQNQ